MNLYQVIPGPPRTINFSTARERAALAPTLRPPVTPWVRAIMVTDPAGHTVDSSGSSRGLTRGADRALLALYRENADVVIVGAETIRREPVPTPRHTPLVIVSGSGDLRGHQLIVREGGRFLLVTSEAGATRQASEGALPGAEVVTLPGPGPFPAREILDSLTGRAETGNVLVEGGRALWETFAPITHELCVATTGAPRDERAGVPEWWPHPPDSLALHSLMTDDTQMLYYRYLTPLGGESPDQRPEADLS